MKDPTNTIDETLDESLPRVKIQNLQNVLFHKISNPQYVLTFLTGKKKVYKILYLLKGYLRNFRKSSSNMF